MPLFPCPRCKKEYSDSVPRLCCPACLEQYFAMIRNEEERSAFALVEASALIDPTADRVDRFATQPLQRVRADSKVTNMLEWVKRELND